MDTAHCLKWIEGVSYLQTYGITLTVLPVSAQTEEALYSASK